MTNYYFGQAQLSIKESYVTLHHICTFPLQKCFWQKSLLFILWRIFVIFWSPSFTSSGKIFIIERVTTPPPTWNFYDSYKLIISFNQFNDTSKDHCPRGTFALITKTTLLTFTFRLTGSHLFLRFNIGTNSDIQCFQKHWTRSWRCLLTQ